MHPSIGPPRKMPTKRDEKWKSDPKIVYTSGESEYDKAR